MTITDALSQAADEQQTLRLLISTCGAVLGSLLVATAAVIAPLIVQSHRHRQEVDQARASRLRDAVVDFVDMSMQEVHYDEEWDEKESWIKIRRERSFATLDTLLLGDDRAASEWLHGFAGDRAFHDLQARRFFVHAALRDLIAWQQGQKPDAEMQPFKYERNSDWKTFRRVDLDRWQQDAAGNAEPIHESD